MNNVLTRVLAVGLLASPVLAETEVQSQPAESETKATVLYVGLDVFKGNSDFDLTASGDLVGKTTVDSDLDGYRLKFGAKLENNWRLQGFFKSEDNDVFANNIYGIGLDLIKAFEVTEKFYPFLQVGVSSDWAELESVPGAIYNEDSLNAFSLKVGAGAIYELTEKIEVLGGIDLQYRSWQDIETRGLLNSKLEREDSGNTLYLGLNVSF